MIEKYTRRKFYTELWYAGTIYISTTQVVVDLWKQSNSYDIGKALSRNRGRAVL